MSVDPAITIIDSAVEFPDVVALSTDNDGVYIFDFDGVISDRTEDDIYKLAAYEGEEELFKEIECRLGVDFSRLDHQYRRHLLFQAAAWHVEIPIRKGKGFDKAKSVSSKYPFFILTARSGWYAVERQRKFVLKHKLLPVDCYNVGRVSKDRQIAMLALEFRDDVLNYVDDSAAHCEIVAKLGLENLNVYTCNDISSNINPEERYHEVMQQFLDLKSPLQ